MNNSPKAVHDRLMETVTYNSITAAKVTENVEALETMVLQLNAQLVAKIKELQEANAKIKELNQKEDAWRKVLDHYANPLDK